ncbi:MAG: hypothetical protein ABIB98_00290 [bacterium]
MTVAHIKKLLINSIRWTTPVLVILLCTLIIAAVSYRPKENMEYGVTFSQKYAKELNLDWKETYLNILDGLKVKNLRLLAYWDDIEKEKGVYDFSDIDFMLSEAEKRNVSVILALGRKLPRWPECFEPKWAKEKGEEYIKTRLLILIPKEVEHLKKYKSIKYWQVENEPFFPFGICSFMLDHEFVRKEVDMVRSIDTRPILVSDSGEGGTWIFSYSLADYLAISMYRKVWLSFWGYFSWPFPAPSYKIKAALLNIPIEKIFNTELQAEPWSNKPIIEATNEELEKTMTHQDFIKTIEYAKQTGITKTYFWGVEWWYYQKQNGDPFYWNTAKNIFSN